MAHGRQRPTLQAAHTAQAQSLHDIFRADIVWFQVERLACCPSEGCKQHGQALRAAASAAGGCVETDPDDRGHGKTDLSIQAAATAGSHAEIVHDWRLHSRTDLDANIPVLSAMSSSCCKYLCLHCSCSSCKAWRAAAALHDATACVKELSMVSVMFSSHRTHFSKCPGFASCNSPPSLQSCICFCTGATDMTRLSAQQLFWKLPFHSGLMWASASLWLLSLDCHLLVLVRGSKAYTLVCICGKKVIRVLPSFCGVLCKKRRQPFLKKNVRYWSGKLFVPLQFHLMIT